MSKQIEKLSADIERSIACLNAFEGIPTERIVGKDLGQIMAGEVKLHAAGPRPGGGFGFEFSGGVCQMMAEAYAEQFKSSGAINYLELLFNHTEIGPLTITMQRVEGLTPAQKLAKAEDERSELLEALQCLFEDYKQLADSGDAGNWSLEDIPAGKKAINAINKAIGKD